MKDKRKFVIILLVVAMAIAVVGVSCFYWYQNTHYVSTEDAKVTGDFAKVAPQVSGKLIELNVQEGDVVVKDQIIGRLDAVGISDSSIDTTLLRSPINGMVVKRLATVGEYIFGSSVPTLVLVVDPEKLYVSANIDETKLEKIRPGQKVDIKIDQFDGKAFSGKVASIGQAANSAFSLLPSSSGGTFTKVIQKVPVKIELEKTELKLLPGTNAVVKIHLK